jgi:hypothetical protein
VGAKDGTERLEAALRAELGVQEVDDGQVDEGVPAVEGERDLGGEGTEPEDVERQVHADDGVRMAEPSQQVPMAGGVSQVEGECGARHEGADAFKAVGGLRLGGGDGDGAGEDQVLAGNAVRGDGPCRMKDGLGGEHGALAVGRGSTVCFDVEGR